MRRKVRTILLYIFVTSFVLGCVSLHICRTVLSGEDLRPPPVNLNTVPYNNPYTLNNALQEGDFNHTPIRHVSVVQDSSRTSTRTRTVSILLPAWEVLVIVSPESRSSFSDSGDDYYCLYQNDAKSPARFSGILPFTNRTTFKCILPHSTRRRRPFMMPILTKTQEKISENASTEPVPVPELFRWTFLVYDSFSTENDVVVFAKGVNNRQGINRPPESLMCVFGDDVNNGVKTAVISSSQEVFRCLHPESTAVTTTSGADEERIKVSIQITDENRVVPSVAYYTTPKRTLAIQKPKSQLCACTMVYNVAKFLREWVVYHSKIGVEKFILYDNDSDDDLNKVVAELVADGYDVTTLFWLWPKTQEAGFSHSAIYSKDSCTWMAYIDVDEFVFSPSWLKSSKPSTHMLKSLLPKPKPSSSSSSSPLRSPLKSQSRNQIGQVSINCNEFGPSNQISHPINGVTQGYNCRRRLENRHKSIVLLDAVDQSLLNAIHHFVIKEEYRVKRVTLEDAVVNHYKYQAWSEFRTKFRRRVSAYVVDWMDALNPKSKDRTPGLGFAPIEPKGWAQKFCEVRDDRLKILTERWFGSFSHNFHQDRLRRKID